MGAESCVAVAEGGNQTIVGVGVGLAGAVGAGFAIRSQLYEVSAADPVILREFRENRAVPLSDHDAIGVDIKLGWSALLTKV